VDWQNRTIYVKLASS